jgi:deoxyuridine 5'-triphosphate nucleotidohydrolase
MGRVNRKVIAAYKNTGHTSITPVNNRMVYSKTWMYLAAHSDGQRDDGNYMGIVWSKQPARKHLMNMFVANTFSIGCQLNSSSSRFYINTPAACQMVADYVVDWSHPASKLAALDYFGSFDQSKCIYVAPCNQYIKAAFSQQIEDGAIVPCRIFNQPMLVLAESAFVDLFMPLWNKVGWDCVWSLRFNRTNIRVHAPVSLNHAMPDRGVDGKRYASDAGIDISVVGVSEVLDQHTSLYETSVSVNIPPQYFGMLVPRSSLAKSGFMMTNSIGIIDNGYTGTIKVALTRVGDASDQVVFPFKCAQLILMPQVYANVQFVQTKQSSRKTQPSATPRAHGRGANGYGSTSDVSKTQRDTSEAYTV